MAGNSNVNMFGGLQFSKYERRYDLNLLGNGQSARTYFLVCFLPQATPADDNWKMQAQQNTCNPSLFCSLCTPRRHLPMAVSHVVLILVCG
mmetsp:Transcript_27731/g.64238  ORF Transcript_27731/g.64238 Transcript_27731/m.64238 type:complete len:91 (-) Transcript_27731:767-1039(-)